MSAQGTEKTPHIRVPNGVTNEQKLQVKGDYSPDGFFLQFAGSQAIWAQSMHPTCTQDPSLSLLYWGVQHIAPFRRAGPAPLTSRSDQGSDPKKQGSRVCPGESSDSGHWDLGRTPHFVLTPKTMDTFQPVSDWVRVPYATQR